MLDRAKSLEDLVVLNDEAHHVHDQQLAWESIAARHPWGVARGLSAWLDFSATPKDQNGMYFPWTVVDYLWRKRWKTGCQGASHRHQGERSETANRRPRQGDQTERGGKVRILAQRRSAALEGAWRVYRKLGTKPVLFIMAEKNVYADALGDYLCKTREFGFSKSEVLVIHTDRAGEITRRDLDKARQAARDIDGKESKIKAIVSVMMLREGWDVRNVTVVLGLRPFTAKSEILPEQVVGRGLRLMTQVSPDRTQTLEVLGTRNLLDLLRTQLEAEGVGVASAKQNPPLPVIIEPVMERLKYDIAIPITKPTLKHDFRKLSNLKVGLFDAIYDREELDEPFRVSLKLEFATTETEVHQADVAAHELPSAQELLASIANKVIDRAKLPNRFAQLYPAVREYVSCRCFGRTVELDDPTLRSHLARLELQEGIAGYLARTISELTIEHRSIEFDRQDFRLSETRPFSWRRNLPPLEAEEKTIFNFVATYNDFERRFAEFLDKRAKDVVRSPRLVSPSREHQARSFGFDYLKPSGAIGFYHPDWVVVQQTRTGQVNWIVETKGRVWEGTEIKDAAMRNWCERVSAATGAAWRYVRINQSDFDAQNARGLSDLMGQPAPASRPLLLIACH